MGSIGNEDIIEDLSIMQDIWSRAIVIQLYKYQHSKLKSFMNDLKLKRTKTTVNPSRKEIKLLVTQSVDAIMNKQ